MKNQFPRPIGVLQVGRLGDLWWTVPLAEDLSKNGATVEVWFDAKYGNPFRYFPSVVPHPIVLPQYFSASHTLGSIANSALQQINIFARMLLARRTIIWQQIYPFHIAAFLKNRPYPEYLFRKRKSNDFRTARTTLNVTSGTTILYFATSLSLRVSLPPEQMGWIETNLERLAEYTGYEVLYVPPPDDANDHRQYKTWRGNIDEYQQLIAESGLIFGIITSAHVLGQLLGKPVIACYFDRQRQYDTIGRETARLYPGEFLGAKELHSVRQALKTTN